MLSTILAPALKYIAGGLLVVCIVLGVALKVERVHTAKQAAQIVKLNAELQRITTAKNEQRAETTERLKVVTRTIHDADGRAKVVEQAPLPGGCKSPKEVLDADI
jgi:hypothetical protein